MKNHKNKSTKKNIMIKTFYAVGILFILSSIIVLAEEVLIVMPLYIKSILIYLLAFVLIFISNTIEVKENE